MTDNSVYLLENLSVVDIAGADGATIIHNLTTNEVHGLQPGQGRETFITDVRGKTLGHGYLYRLASLSSPKTAAGNTEETDPGTSGFRFFGAPGQSGEVSKHVDKYTIREDAEASIQDDQFHAVVFESKSVATELFQSSGLESHQGQSVSIADCASDLFPVDWLGPDSCVLMIKRSDSDSVCGWLTQKNIQIASEELFHPKRIQAGFPWYGIDLDEKNLPQELDRDESAISFTKGCYLGQETVARLDALGQVQRKLVRWSITGPEPNTGSLLTANDKTVGRLTSITAGNIETKPPVWIALGYARRSHFEAGAIASGKIEGTESSFSATVL